MSNKPTIPSKISDLTNDSDFIETSSTSGLIKNDGTIDTSTYLTSSALSNYVQKSSTSGLIKNDGTIDTSAYITSSALSNYMQKSSTAGLMKNDGTVDTNTYLTSSSITGMLTTSDVKDNLTSTDTNKPLSAKQGKELKTLVDAKQATLVSGTNIKTINNESLLGSGNISISGGGGSLSALSGGLLVYDSTNSVVEYGNNELATKDELSLDTITDNYLTFDDSTNKVEYNGYEVATLNDAPKSHKHGKINNEGKIEIELMGGFESEDYVVYADTSDEWKIKAFLFMPTAKLRESSALSNIGTTAYSTQNTINGAIDTALGNKVSKSSTTGLLKNDGTVDTSAYITSSALSDYVEKSNTTGLLKNDGTVMASGTGSSNWAVGNHTHGRIANNGQVVDSNNQPIGAKILFTDSNSQLTGSTYLFASAVNDNAAHSNLGTSAGATQADINSAIDSIIGSAISYIVGSGS